MAFVHQEMEEEREEGKTTLEMARLHQKDIRKTELEVKDRTLVAWDRTRRYSGGGSSTRGGNL